MPMAKIMRNLVKNPSSVWMDNEINVKFYTLLGFLSINWPSMALSAK
ncbi:hypothetical protein MASR2M70_23000 [Bacillota bacterium]